MKRVQFLDGDHVRRYKEGLLRVMESLPTYHADLVAAMFLISGHPDLFRKALPYFVSPFTWDWPRMMRQQDFSSGILVLARLAIDLFTGSDQTAVSELVDRLDSRNFDLALGAVQVKRWGPECIAPAPEEVATT